ncbi:MULTISPECIES: GerMN domain-containing protein [Paenibacillus]|uniref:GerMN domain-containing protein n=1 Tax=Paenibacillus lautus TaxID=1401 RepID=A0A1R1ANF0_PAELA|nr:GerMN domain-containing protein [Paenibacillus lautus]OME87082.1 hypothetical protein BK123_32050 [Paenibacillus lautus]
MRKKRNRVAFVVLIILFIFIISSCGSNSDMETALSNHSGDSSLEEEIKVYVTDDEMTTLYPLNVEIRYNSAEEKISEALKALAVAKAEGKTGLWSGVTFRNMVLSGGDLTVDLQDMSYLGSSGEALALEAIKKTVFQFEEVEYLDLHVDGEAVSSLMGHLDLEHPIKKNKE